MPKQCNPLFRAALLGGVLLALVPPATAPAQSAADSMATVQLPAALDRVLRDYERAWRARDAAALAALFTDDGFVLSGSRPPARGRAAIEERYSGAGGPLHLRAIAYAADDTVAYIIGMYGPTPEQGSNGKFTLTLRRPPGGAWLIASDMDNPNAPPQRRAAPAAVPPAGIGLSDGVQLVYASGDSRQPPWIYDSVRVVRHAEFPRCVRVIRRGQRAQETCLRGDTLFEQGATGDYRATRPVGPGMRLRTRTARGNTLDYQTGALVMRRGPDGADMVVIQTMIVTRDSTGTVTQRLREEYAPTLLTAIAGVFEVPDGDGWRTTREFRLAEIIRISP